jgi:glycosyltransferase involved in cell wall biosynthesis
MVLSIIVPVYNERHTLGTALVAVARALPNVGKEIIVVHDCSRDGTREWLKANFPDGPRRGSMIELDGEGNLVFIGDQTLTIRPIYHERNRSKGAGLQTGFAMCSGDVLVIPDADLEYDPNDWEQMYDLIAVRKVADVAFGSRFYGRPHRSTLFSSLSRKSPDLISFQRRFQSDADGHRVLLQDDDERSWPFTALDSRRFRYRGGTKCANCATAEPPRL